MTGKPERGIMTKASGAGCVRYSRHTKYVWIGQIISGEIRDYVKSDVKPSAAAPIEAEHASLVALWKSVPDEGRLYILAFQVEENVADQGQPPRYALRWALPTESGEPGEEPFETARQCVQTEIAKVKDRLDVYLDPEPVFIKAIPSDRDRKVEPRSRTERLIPPVWVELEELFFRLRERGRPFHHVLKRLWEQKIATERYTSVLNQMQSLLRESGRAI
jgi:hypothetical protein